jgi:Cu/Ag efflux protein CusF
MKKFVAFAVAVAAVPALVGPSFAQTEKKPATTPAVTEAEKKPATPAPAKMDPAPREAAMKSLAGEIVAMDQATRTFTVKHMADKKPVEMKFSVEDAAMLAQFKTGDHVKITYAEMGDTRIARSVVKG